MGVYINMEIPENSDMIVIYSDGTARKYLSYTKVIIDEAKAITIPPHGRTIDADALYEDCALDANINVMASAKRINEYMQLKIDEASTIIPADEGE